MIIGIGCDITRTERFEKKDTSFASKILSPEEILIYKQKVGKQKTEFLAGRFCAKEAIIKALPKEYEMPMSKINIFYENEKPKCIIEDFCVYVSISHEKEYAISYVCIQKELNN